jgi:hypothetical protein
MEELKSAMEKEEKKKKKDGPRDPGPELTRPGPETPSMTPGMPNLSAPPRALPAGSF